MYRDGTKHLLALDPDTFTALRYRSTMLAHTLSILSAAAYWERYRYAVEDPPWTLIGMYTRGCLLVSPGDLHLRLPHAAGATSPCPRTAVAVTTTTSS